MTNFPDTLTPLNLKAYLTIAFNICGCTEFDLVLAEIKSLLQWHNSGSDRPSYETLFAGNAGVFYLLAGYLDQLRLCEHGTAIRHPWLTEDGKRLLTALEQITVEEIENAKGEAYDGLWYE